MSLPQQVWRERRRKLDYFFLGMAGLWLGLYLVGSFSPDRFFIGAVLGWLGYQAATCRLEWMAALDLVERQQSMIERLQQTLLRRTLEDLEDFFADSPISRHILTIDKSGTYRLTIGDDVRQVPVDLELASQEGLAAALEQASRVFYEGSEEDDE